MRKSFLVICCAALLAAAGGNLALAEESEFKISSYIPEKFVDLEWKIVGNLSLNDNNRWSSRYTPISSLHYYTQTSDVTDLGGRLNSRLNYRYETVPRFLYALVDLTGLYSRVNRNTSRDRTGSDFSQVVEEYQLNRSESKSDPREFDLIATGDAGQYFSGDFFASIETFLGFMYSETPGATDYSFRERVEYQVPYVITQRYESNTEQSPDFRRVDLSVALLPGWGRFYQGNYASTAMYIIEELRSNGVLLREPTQDEMLALCDIVYQNRREHAVDDRIRKIESLDAIMSYLSDAGISDAGNGRGCLLIQDVWDYFPRYSRAFGLRARLGPGFEYSHQRSRSTTVTDYEDFLTEYNIDNPAVIDTIWDVSWHEYYITP